MGTSKLSVTPADAYDASATERRQPRRTQRSGRSNAGAARKESLPVVACLVFGVVVALVACR
jgi:hypothetical protein